MKIKEHFRQNVIKRVEKIPPGYPRTHIKIPGFLYIHNPGIFYSGIFQALKSRDYLVPGFFDPGISRDIPGPGYPVDIPNLYYYTTSKFAESHVTYIVIT